MCLVHVSIFVYICLYVSNYVHLSYNNFNMYPYNLIYNLNFTYIYVCMLAKYVYII